jgi:superfamily II DNA or RNA helicase
LTFSLTIIEQLELNKEFYLPNQTEIIDNYVQTIFPLYNLHDYQKRIKDKSIQILLNPSYSNRLLIHMPTGAGKTKTAMELISDYFRCKTILGGFDTSGFVIWLAHSKELNDQALDSFNNTWKLRGDSKVDVFKLYGDNDYTENILQSESAIIFIGFQKFNSMIKSNNHLAKSIKKRILDKVKLVIVDEAHKSLATTYESALNLLTNSNAGVQLVGLTATPGRSSSETGVDNNHLAYFFNSQKISLIDEIGVKIDNPISYLQNMGVLARIEREELITDVQLELSEAEIRDLKIFGDDKLKKILSSLSKNPARNKLIIDKVKELFLLGDSILIFACSVEHCIILQTLLNLENIEAATILGSTSKFERELSISNFKNDKLKVLINYNVLTTGFDAPNLNSLIIARPTTSIVLYSQMVGRALRGKENGGNEKNKIVDLKDNFIIGTESDMFEYHEEFWKVNNV